MIIVEGKKNRTNLEAGMEALSNPIVVHMEPAPAEALLMHIRKLEADNNRLRSKLVKVSRSILDTLEGES